MTLARHRLCTRRICAKFVDEIAEQRVDGPRIGEANEGHCLVLLRDKPCQTQPRQMAREGGRGDAELLAQLRDRQARRACAHQHPADLQPSRVTERLKLLRCAFEVHCGVK